MNQLSIWGGLGRVQSKSHMRARAYAGVPVDPPQPSPEVVTVPCPRCRREHPVLARHGATAYCAWTGRAYVIDLEDT